MNTDRFQFAIEDMAVAYRETAATATDRVAKSAGVLTGLGHTVEAAIEAAAANRMAEIADRFTTVDPVNPMDLLAAIADVFTQLDPHTGFPHEQVIKAETLILFGRFIRDMAFDFVH
jgi:hypothetical protein